jgi:uncharacterized membrane protein
VKDVSVAEMGILRKRAQQIAGNLVAAIGVVVSVFTLIGMLTSSGFRNGVKDHPYWVLGGLLVTIVAIFVLLNVMLDMRAELRRLRRSEHLRLTGRDTRAVTGLLERVPPEGILVTWLRTGFQPSPVPRERLDDLHHAHQYLGSDPSRFGDSEAAARYLQLTNATGTLIEKLQSWTSLEAGNAERIIRWEQGPRHDRAVTEIQAARGDFISAYDALLRACHERGIEPADPG